MILENAPHVSQTVCVAVARWRVWLERRLNVRKRFNNVIEVNEALRKGKAQKFERARDFPLIVLQLVTQLQSCATRDSYNTLRLEHVITLD